jgi:hypothetical protein
MGVDFNGPTAVILWMRDGTEREEVFASRFLAELYLAMVPFTVTPEGYHEVEAAMLSPLVVVG